MAENKMNAVAELEALKLRLAALEQENQSLKTAVNGKRKGGELTIKTSEKGAVSVYGLQRWPVTLYQEQWGRLIEFAPQITNYIKAHPELATKDQPFEKPNNEPLTDAEFLALSKRDDLTPAEQARMNTYVAAKAAKVVRK